MIQHTSIVRGVAGLLISHLRASHMRVSQFAEQEEMCVSTVMNLLNDDTKNPTIRTLVKILNGIKKLEDVIQWSELREYTAVAATVIRLHEKRKRVRKVKRRAA